MCTVAGNTICSVTGPRKVSCYELDGNDKLVLQKHITTHFELNTGSNSLFLHISGGNSLFIGKDTNLLVEKLDASAGSSNFTLPSSVMHITEAYGVVYLLLQNAGGSGSYSTMQWDSAKAVWTTPAAYGFEGSKNLFNIATSNAVLYMDSWGQLYTIYGQGNQLMLNQLSFGPVYPLAAPAQCTKITKISMSAKAGHLKVLCSDVLFVYSIADARWLGGAEQWGMEYNVQEAKDLANPRVFAIPTLTNPNCSLPGTVVFVTLDGQRSFVSLRASTMNGSTFTQSGSLFCYNENGLTGVLCHNVSVFLSNGATGSLSSYLYPTKDGATIVGSIGSKVVVGYADDNTGEVKLEALPKQPKDDGDKVEIDRKSLCDEMKESVPSLYKIFCSNRVIP